MNYTNLIVNVEDGICTITINRPDKLNALNRVVLEELDKAMDTVYTSDEIKGVIITGQGEKAFVAGADIKEFMDVAENKGATLAEKGQHIFFKIEDCSKPVIAAVNGFALGGGCELAMACHFRIASDQAKFGQPEVNLGLIPGYGGTQRLTALIGKGRAMEMILMGNMVSADEAFNYGLVTKITSADELLPTTLKILKVILSKSPFAVAKAIKAINAFDHTRAGFNEETRLFGETFQSEDKREGTTAFIEKRKPVFTGK